MTKVLEQALRVMVLDYLKRAANKSVYNRWDKGGYGEVPLPTLPYIITPGDDDNIKQIIDALEGEIDDIR